jgi:hypothetical protein
LVSTDTRASPPGPKGKSRKSSQLSINPGAGPLARRGLWALPAWAALLFADTLTHQPDWKTDLAGWSRYVTTPQFLASHLVAMGALPTSRGHPRAGLWTMVTGVSANVLTAAGLGIAAFAQPAIGRDYLAGHTAQAGLLVNTVVNGEWMNVTAVTSGMLLIASAVVAGVAVTRTGSLPRAAGIGFAISMVLFAIGAIPDNFLQSIAGVLMIASTVWIAAAAGRRGAPAPMAAASDTTPAGGRPEVRRTGLARVR